MNTLLGLLEQMQADMPRVQRESARRRNQPHHKRGLNRANHEDASWMPAHWIMPTQGTYCGNGPPQLFEEDANDW